MPKPGYPSDTRIKNIAGNLNKGGRGSRKGSRKKAESIVKKTKYKK